MWIKQDTGTRQVDFFKKNFVRIFSLLCVFFSFHSHSIYCNESATNCAFRSLEASKDKKLLPEQFNRTLTYYLYVSDFVNSFIQIPTSNLLTTTTTIGSNYLAGRAPIYNSDNVEFGTCSASFLCIQNENQIIYTDISNYLTIDNGLIVTWFTPTTLLNLELDNLVNSMVTECIVLASTKVGFNPFYGQTFNLIVSSDDEKIYFQFTRTGTIF